MDMENRLVVAKGEGIGGRMEWEAGVKVIIDINGETTRSYRIAQGTI